MGTPLFGLIEELEIDKSVAMVQNRIESKIFMIGCLFISLSKIFNIITLFQFFCLFLFYMVWFVCNIVYTPLNLEDKKKYI